MQGGFSTACSNIPYATRRQATWGRPSTRSRAHVQPATSGTAPTATSVTPSGANAPESSARQHSTNVCGGTLIPMTDHRNDPGGSSGKLPPKLKEVLYIFPDRKARKFMQKTNQITSSQVAPDVFIELENKYVALARKEVEARERASIAVTPEWLDALEDRAAASPYLSSRGKAALPGTSQEVEQMSCLRVWMCSTPNTSPTNWPIILSGVPNIARSFSSERLLRLSNKSYVASAKPLPGQLVRSMYRKIMCISLSALPRLFPLHRLLTP